VSAVEGTDPAPIRVVVAKVGLDGHDRGAKTVALALRDAGYEVVYAGLRQTPESVVATVVDEGADALGVSLLSGAHLEVMARVCALLDEAGADTVVMLGGNVPRRDHEELRRYGVDGIFPTGANYDEIAAWLRQEVTARRAGVTG
jgi:methylmalonyl-CoA mutase cobalamin-binding domain/chain